MAIILRTKLFIPQQPAAVIERPRLWQILDQGVLRKLSVVMAPAGYGKTTLVATWLDRLTADDDSVRPLWLSLDERDDEPLRFFTYFASAFCQLDESWATIRDNYVQSGGDGAAVEALLIALLNRLADFEGTVILVLDDFHEITLPEIHEPLSFWLDHQPANVHLVLTSRTEPALPLPRLRVRRHVVEIDLARLRFTQEETADFLTEHMGLTLASADIVELDRLTEGWVASLQLAALSLQNQTDPAAFIQTFRGTNRYIVDYLVQEVLAHQPDDVRRFLLQTSILKRFNVDLCHAVTGNEASQQLLDRLDQSRLFLIPLDDSREWYRYHHLFADCLQAEFARTIADDAADKVMTYHVRACRWLEESGYYVEAIEHAFAADYSALAAELMGRHGRNIMAQQGDLHFLRQMFDRLTPEQIEHSPQLLVMRAWLLLDTYLDRGQSVDKFLQAAVRVAALSDNELEAGERGDFETEVALAWASQERLRGNLSKAIELSEKALAVSENAVNPILKIGAWGSLATTYYQVGKISGFLTLSQPRVPDLDQQAVIPYARYVFISYLLDAWRLNGEIASAVAFMERIDASYQQQRHSLGAAVLTLSWAEILREQNRLDDARALLLSALDVLRPLRSMASFLHVGVMTLAHIEQALGNTDGALTVLQNTVQAYPLGEIPSASARLPATEALIYLRQGNLLAAQAWARDWGFTADDVPDFLCEIDCLVLCRIWLAQGDFVAAQTLLGRLETAVRQDGRVARLIEVYLLQARLLFRSGRKDEAFVPLGHALDLAKAGGFVRLILDEGSEMVPLLQQLAGRGRFVTYIQRLLACFSEVKPVPMMGVSTAVATPVEPLLNPLTDRELATLRYLATNMTIPEIAEQMVVASSTIRTYVKRIYSKMDVHNRIEAVNRGRALSLV